MKKETNQREKETIRDVREKADRFIAGGIRNADALGKALPVLLDLKERINLAKRNLKASESTYEMLSELCSRYALAHESVFRLRKLILNQQGVRVGDIDLGEFTYHFVNGFKGYERDDNGKLTQDFLQTLPAEWHKTTEKIDTSGIDEAKVTDEELAKFHLRQKVNNEWSARKRDETTD